MELTTTKILIVDDDAQIREDVRSALASLEAEFLFARNGNMAVGIAQEELPDLILMDWQMPEMSGIEAVQVLRSTESTKQVSIIVMTGIMQEVADLVHALDSGAVDFLRKPIDPCELLARVNATIRSLRQEAAIRALLLTEKELLVQNLNGKERELASKTLYDHQRDELLERLLAQVGRLDRITNHVYATDIKPLERELKGQLNLAKDWCQFNKHFEEVYPGFFDRLVKKYRSLTQRDCKLCAYIRMGMCNSEIARFTHVAKGSVERALNRLKKKLGLTERDNLREFIFKID